MTLTSASVSTFCCSRVVCDDFVDMCVLNEPAEVNAAAATAAEPSRHCSSVLCEQLCLFYVHAVITAFIGCFKQICSCRVFIW